MPLVIHKGSSNGKIDPENEIPYTCQQKAWVNKHLILNWIDYK
jgi:hypothetical protein